MLSATRIDFAKMEMTLDANEELPAVELGLLEETFLKYDKDFSGYVPYQPPLIRLCLFVCAGVYR